MNFDQNLMTTLMQLLSAKQPPQGDRSNTTSQNKEHVENSTRYANAFEMQNGIGDRLNIDFESEKHNTSSNTQNPMQSIIENMSNENPIFGMLSMLNNNKDMSMLAPLLAGMMSNKANIQSNNEQNIQNKQSNTVNNQKHDSNKQNQNVQNKTQPRLFTPIAFAGYNVATTLCKLYLATR